MLSHVTATINPLRYSVIIYIVCAFVLEKSFEFVGKRIGTQRISRAFKDIFIVMEITVPARAKVSLPMKTQIVQLRSKPSHCEGFL